MPRSMSSFCGPLAPLRILVSLLLALACSLAQAQIYQDGYDVGIPPVLTRVNGTFTLEPSPVESQLTWLLAEMAAGESTTLEEVNTHFDASYLAVAGQSAAETKTKIDNLRTGYPNPKIFDVITLTPMNLDVVVDTPGTPYPAAYIRLKTRYSGSAKILTFTVFAPYSGFQPSVVEDRTATLAQIAAKFDPAAPNTLVPTGGASSLFVGRIARDTDVCSATLASREVDTLRGTGSIFKLWVLGGVASVVASGAASASTPVTLVAAKRAGGAEMNVEPDNTVFTLAHITQMMMGVSDNTATNLAFALAGRGTVNQIVTDFGTAAPTVLTPFLDISEQFHVLRSFDLPTATAFVNGTEQYQQNFLDTQIVPLGPLTTFPYFNVSLLTTGTWRVTASDVCRAYAGLRRGSTSTEAGALVSRAASSSVVFSDVRNKWDRVWFKAGSLAAGDGNHVLTYSWMLEDADQDPYVVVGMISSDTGGIDNVKVQSALGRVLLLLRALPP